MPDRSQKKNVSGSPDLGSFALLVVCILFFVGVPFELLRVGTSLPSWAIIAISVPAGAALFCGAYKWAEM